MIRFFTKLLIICTLVVLLYGCKEQINNGKEFANNLTSAEREETFSYSVLPVKNIILKNETAVYVGSITNNADDDYFLIEVNNSNFIFYSFSVLVTKNSTTAFDIHLKPNSSLQDCKTYFPAFSIKSENSSIYIVKEEIIPIFIFNNSNNCYFRDRVYY